MNYKDKIKLIILVARETIIKMQARLEAFEEALKEYEDFEELENNKKYKI